MKVYCTKDQHGDLLIFYLAVKGESFYLFTQRYSKSVWDFYNRPQYLNIATDRTRAKRNPMIINVMKRLMSYKKYIMLEYNIDYSSCKKRKIRTNVA